jgi:arylsulfatase A-like enzyme
MSNQLRNVLVIMLDSQRADVLGCASDGPGPVADDFAQVRTPHIDAVAAGGTVFDRAYAEYPVTVPSRTALVSGCYTFTNRPWCPLRPYDFHIAELLREHGFTTACWSDTPMNRGANLDRGFDLFDEITVGKCRRQAEEIQVDLMGAAFPESGAEAEVQFWINTLRGRHIARRDYGCTCPKLLFDKAIQWLESRPKEPFFAWIDTFDPHEPWCPEPPYDTMYPRPEGGRYIPMPHGPSIQWMSQADLGAVRALYMGDVTRTDEQVGRVMQTLEHRGLADDTLVVIISDHGEPFGEHGIIRKCRPWLHEELVHIPMLIRLPDGTGHGTQIPALVETCDLMPTILAFLEADAPDGMTGESLLPLMRSDVGKIRDYAYSGYFNRQWSIRTHEWSYLLPLDEATPELHRRPDDPTEQNNLVRERADVAAELELELRRFVEALRRGATPSVAAWRKNW